MRFEKKMTKLTICIQLEGIHFSYPMKLKDDNPGLWVFPHDNLDKSFPRVLSILLCLTTIVHLYPTLFLTWVTLTFQGLYLLYLLLQSSN
jgi:hypothetical protein